MDHERKLKSIILNALNQCTSDIHLTKNDQDIRMEYRSITGNLVAQKEKLSLAFFEYLKYRSKIDLLNLMKPQSSQFEVGLSETTIELRCAYVRSRRVETIVLRIMNPPHLLTLPDLFIDKDLLKQIQTDLKYPSGLILFSGTTGSGKTTTLYTCLDSLKGSKIYSVEDPVERLRDHMVQLEVNERTHFDFNEAIKQVLRHDPNIIVIGEIRSSKEAQAAIRCALSGHLVLSTIHANSAYMTLQRLADFEVSKELVHDILVRIYYQSLDYSEEKGRRMATFSCYPKS